MIKIIFADRLCSFRSHSFHKLIAHAPQFKHFYHIQVGLFQSFLIYLPVKYHLIMWMLSQNHFHNFSVHQTVIFRIRKFILSIKQLIQMLDIECLWWSKIFIQIFIFSRKFLPNFRMFVVECLILRVIV